MWLPPPVISHSSQPPVIYSWSHPQSLGKQFMVVAYSPICTGKGAVMAVREGCEAGTGWIWLCLVGRFGRTCKASETLDE